MQLAKWAWNSHMVMTLILPWEMWIKGQNTASLWKGATAVGISLLEAISLFSIHYAQGAPLKDWSSFALQALKESHSPKTNGKKKEFALQLV